MSSERLRGISASVPVTRLERAGWVTRLKSWLAAVDKRPHSCLVNWARRLNINVYMAFMRDNLGDGGGV